MNVSKENSRGKIKQKEKRVDKRNHLGPDWKKICHLGDEWRKSNQKGKSEGYIIVIIYNGRWLCLFDNRRGLGSDNSYN